MFVGCVMLCGLKGCTDALVGLVRLEGRSLQWPSDQPGTQWGRLAIECFENAPERWSLQQVPDGSLRGARDGTYQMPTRHK